MNATNGRIVVVESSPGIVDRILTSFSQTPLASDLVIAPDAESVDESLARLNPRLLLIRSTQIVDLPRSIPVVVYVTRPEDYASLILIPSFDRILLTEDMIKLIPELVPVWCDVWETAIASQNQQITGDLAHVSTSAIAQLMRLSAREKQVVELIASGKSNREVADELGLSTRTIQKHRSSIVRKLDIRSPAQLTRLVLAADGQRTISIE